jgi:hypothetical protein
MTGTTFEIEASDTHVCWAELQEGKVVVHRTARQPSLESRALENKASEDQAPEDEILLRWDIDVFRDILAWAGQAAQTGMVTATFTGPLAQQIREHSRELGLTNEMFLWHAVKIFIEVGTST